MSATLVIARRRGGASYKFYEASTQAVYSPGCGEQRIFRSLPMEQPRYGFETIESAMEWVKSKFPTVELAASLMSDNYTKLGEGQHQRQFARDYKYVFF